MTSPPTPSEQVLPGGVPSLLAALPNRYFASAAGGRCYDQHGNVYIDFACGFGSVSIGHCAAAVNRAVTDQLQRGTMMLSDSPSYHHLCRTLLRYFPSSESCRFFKTGSEAVCAAVRLARAFTGRKTIIRCGFHGWHDTLVSPHVRWHLHTADDAPPQHVEGVLQHGMDDYVTWNGVDLAHLASLIDSHRKTFAALIIDPIQVREPIGRNLLELCLCTRKSDGLVIFDEAKTGFRTCMGGVQELYGVQADLTILSKGIANGFPLSALLGRTEIIAKASAARIMGTYNGELLSIAAANSTLSLLGVPSSIPHMWKIGQQLIDGTNNILNRYGLLEHICVVPYRWPSMPFFAFQRESKHAQKVKDIFYRRVAERGLLLLKDHMSFSCLEHTEEDVALALSIIDDTLRGCAQLTAAV